MVLILGHLITEMNNNNINEVYKLNSILDIYNGTNNNQSLETAANYYIHHNTIPDGVILADKVVPVNNMHKISGAYYYYENNLYNTTSYEFIPLLINQETSVAYHNNYKLISSKDIDYENAYLKYANQTHDYNKPIEYYELVSQETNSGMKTVPVLRTNSTYTFDRQITPYINNSYDLLNTVDYLCNRIKALYFLIGVIKEQRNMSN